MRLLLLLVLLPLLAGCGRDAPAGPAASDPAALPWDDVLAAARGATVDVAMWQGDPYVNDYMQGWVADAVAQRYGVTLRFISAQGGQVVSALMTELEAGAPSAYDLVWINGETFYQLRAIDALYGPFTDALPNARLVDFDNPFIGIDFQQPIDGMEAPWGNVQFALIYDTTRVSDPPRTPAALADWVRAHPGRFTFDVAFTGMTFLKGLLIDFAGGPEALAGPFDEAAYAAPADSLWRYLRAIRPYLWNEGRSFPSGVAQLHQLFVNGEVDFTMSNNDGEVDNKVLQGLFPPTVRAYVPATGSIQNSHYWGIPRGARDKAAALVVIDFLLSPEAQLRKLDPAVWGDGTVLALDRLPDSTAARFRDLPARRHAPPRAALQGRALPELAPEYMIRLYDDFRAEIIEAE